MKLGIQEISLNQQFHTSCVLQGLVNNQVLAPRLAQCHFVVIMADNITRLLGEPSTQTECAKLVIIADG